MEILLQQNYHTTATDIQQKLDSKEAQIKNLSEQIQQNSANMQAQEAEIQELRVEAQTQRVEIQSLQLALQEKSRDLQEKTKDLQDKINELLEQRLQIQKELNEKTVGLANCIKEIESIKISLGTNQEKLQRIMTLPQPQKNSEKGHEFNGASQYIGRSSNASEGEEVLPYIPISSTNKTVR